MVSELVEEYLKCKEEQLAIDNYFKKKSKGVHMVEIEKDIDETKTFYVDTGKPINKEKLIREVKESMKKR